MIALGGELRAAQGRTSTRDADVDRLIAMLRRWSLDNRSADRFLRGLTRRNQDSPEAEPLLRFARTLINASRDNLVWMTRQLEQFGGQLTADRKALEQIAAPLDNEVLRARMVPFAEACAGLARTVRDLATSLGKDVAVQVDGGKTEVDRHVVAAIKDPLLHLVRNAVDHGIETPAVRTASGKPARARIVLAAALRQGRVEITVADDGRGFDLAAIKAKAEKQGLQVPDDERAIARLAFTHGFSTSNTVTEISGRGVGLDVVKSAVEAIRGTCDVVSKPGQGTRFILNVPLTHSRLHALLVGAGGRTYAIEAGAVRGMLRAGAGDIHMMENRPMVMFEDRPVPVAHLADTLGAAREPPQGGDIPLVVLGNDGDFVAFAVDDLFAEQEVVVKDLSPRLRHVDGVTGATFLPNGQIALILSAPDLMRAVLGRESAGPAAPVWQTLEDHGGAARKRLLVADDSITTRTLVKSILEAGGYTVTTAADGMEAWQLLQERGADLVVSDVDMPRMDGIALTEAIRGSKRLRDLPVILVTGREAEDDRMRGMNAGADAYLTKSTFDQSGLIHAIEQLL